jgi:hypothetical protein
MFRIPVWLAACLMLAACGAAEPKWAPDEAVEAAAFVSGTPPSITLYTVINNRNESGAHSGMLINGSQRVLFDPAGTFQHPMIPERNDVHFGMTDRMIAFYVDYHTRDNFRVVEETHLVTPEVAAMVMRRAMDYGAVPKAQCANSISTILGGVPQFASIKNTWYPRKLSAQYGALPGVTARVITNENVDTTHGVILVQADGSPG